MAAGIDCADEDNFKPVFKRYKNRKLNLDLSDVVNFLKQVDGQVVQSGVEEHLIKFNPSCEIGDGLGLKPVSDWHCFTLKCAPGFIYISNPFKYGHQRYWLKRLLQDIPNPANKSNLLGKLPDESIWNLHVQNQRSKLASKSTYSQLRWVTFGYHYNWSTKLYDLEDHSKFPEDIGLLSAFIATSLGFSTFKPEAAIINYYNMNSTLGGHNDHSELDHDAPLISFSFGQSAIFLVGGLTKAVPPTPILLRSGDIIVLSSSSRLAYHGVPRILHDDSENIKHCWGKISERSDKERCKDGEKGVDNCRAAKLLEIPNEIFRGSHELSNECKEIMSFSDIKSLSCTGECSNLENSDQSKGESISRKLSSAITEASNSGKYINLDQRNENVRERTSKMVSDPYNELDVGLLSSDSSSSDLNQCSSCLRESWKVLPVLSVNERSTSEGHDFDHVKRFSDEKTMGGESASSFLPKAKRVKPDIDICDCEMSFRKNFPNCDILLGHIKETTKLIQNDTVWEPFDKHLQNARLNVSVRQVNKI